MCMRYAMCMAAAALLGMVLAPGIASADQFRRLKEFRSIDAYGNNEENPDWGQAGLPLMRFCSAGYGDGSGAPSGAGRPNARYISVLVAAQDEPIYNSKRASGFLFQWGQFLDHDLDLVPVIEPAEPFDISIPIGDPYFDPLGTGTEVMPFDRSFYFMVDGVRQQMNDLTSFIDGSNVYGSDEETAAGLRTLDGTGRLKTSDGALLPFNLDGDPGEPGDPPFFVAGDVRVNEQVALSTMHTLFVREHNLWARRVRDDSSVKLDDETIYQRARAMVIAELQCITYNEFLPVLLGRGALGRYSGYKSWVEPMVGNEFAAAAFRVGHTLLPPQLLRLDKRLRSIPSGPLALRDAFFNPVEVIEVGIEPYLRGLAWQPAQEVDRFVVDDVRNFLFGLPGEGGFDLVSLNIQRGRDHGLPNYNQVRMDLGLTPVTDFSGISSDPATQQTLADAYGTVDDLDLWVAGISEDHVDGAMIGETFWTILTEQFSALRDGDRFWYQRYLPPNLRREVEGTTLADIIRRNTKINREIPDNVFIVPRR